ncbi:ribonuclease T2-like [Lodderomyces elongisporus]|uniref:T2 family ribonuclease n=1 Tax=Lodderomyces elongisporus TaxID=36914 RepID=UPI00291F87CE|nr:T2 family ribonuclease [Lodderomyces elongisporus]WLF81502.1 ribonuclease T2-like [Lodderomyces elongisporus]
MQFLLIIAAYILVQASAGSVFSSSCPLDANVSCSSSDREPSCCFESPGGVLVQTQFWNYSPSDGPPNLFTLHGLWSDLCDGSHKEYCGYSSMIPNDANYIRNILVLQFHNETFYNNLKNVWRNVRGTDQSLWAHEWNKHGTCINTIAANCYPEFEDNKNFYDYLTISYNLYMRLPTYKWLAAADITPSKFIRYTKAQIQDALSSNFGQQVYFRCDSNNAISEVWYFHHIQGSLLQNKFIPIDTLSSSNCPSENIMFLPKTVRRMYGRYR